MLAALAALASALTWALGSLLFRRLLERERGARPPSPAALNLFKNALAALVLGVFWMAEGAQIPGNHALPWLLASGVLGFALGDSLYLAALPEIGVQRAAMVCQLHVPLATILAFVLFGSRIPCAALVAMGVVLLGVTLVLLDERGARSVDPLARQRGLRLAALATLAYAANVVVGHHGFVGVALFAGSMTRVVAGIAGAFVLAPRTARELVRPFHERALWRPLLLASFFGSVIGLPLFHYGLRELEPGIAAVLFATTPLFTLLLGFFFGERHGARAWIGTVVGFAGVAGVVLAS